jgi:DNA-binding response OmpR family regulator
MAKRRVLLVDDEVAVLLTMKAVLEISGFEVDTAASAREGKLSLKKKTYDMVITDMRMESDESGREVIIAARTAPYHPAVALLTAFPVADEDWQGMGADKMLVKPMQTRLLIQQIEKLLETHQAKLKKLEPGGVAAGMAAGFAAGLAAAGVGKPTPVKKAPVKAKRATAGKKAAGKKVAAKKKS